MAKKEDSILHTLDEGEKIRCSMPKQNKIQLLFDRTMTIHLCDCTKYQPRDCHINLQQVKTQPELCQNPL